MALDLVCAVTADGLAEAGECDRLDRDAVSITSRLTARPSRRLDHPPGRLNRPCAGGRARRTTSTWPSRTIAALTARKGRVG